MTGMAMREQAAVRIDRQFAAKLNASALDEAPALALGAKAEVFELDDDDRSKAIVKLGHVDVFGSESRHREGARAGLLRGRGREAQRLTDVLVRMAFAGTEEIDRLGLEIARALGRGHDYRGAAVAHQRAIEQMQGIGDHPRIEHVIDGDRLAHLRRRIHRGVLATGDRDRRALRRGGAVGMLMRAGEQRIEGGDRRAVGTLELRMAGAGHRFDRLVAREPGELAIGHRDQHGMAHAGRDRRGRVMHDCERGAAARRRRHAVAREDLHVLGDHLGVIHDRLGEGDARDQAVDVVLGDAGVVEREFRGLDVKLGGAQMRHHADFGIGGANDRDFVLQRFRTHLRINSSESRRRARRTARARAYRRQY